MSKGVLKTTGVLIFGALLGFVIPKFKREYPERKDFSGEEEIHSTKREEPKAGERFDPERVYLEALAFAQSVLETESVSKLYQSFEELHGEPDCFELFALRDALHLKFEEEGIESYLRFLLEKDTGKFYYFGVEADLEGLVAAMMRWPVETLLAMDRQLPWSVRRSYFNDLVKALEIHRPEDAAVTWVLAQHPDADLGRIVEVWRELVQAYQQESRCDRLLELPRWQRSSLLKAYVRFMRDDGQELEGLKSLLVVSPDPRDGWEAIGEVIENVDLSEMESLVAELPQLPRWREHRSIVVAAIRKWGAENMESARRWVEEHGSKAYLAVELNRVLRDTALLLGDHETVIEINKTLREELNDRKGVENLPKSLPADVLLSMVAKVRASDALSILRDSEHLEEADLLNIGNDDSLSLSVRSLALAHRELLRSGSDFEKLGESLTNIQDVDLRSEVAKLVLWESVDTDPSGAVNFVNQIDLEDSAAEYTAGLAGALLWRSVGDESLELVTQAVTTPELRTALYMGLMEQWSGEDALQASGWLASQGIDSPVVQRILPRYLEKLQLEDVDAALELTALIKNPQLRDIVMNHVLGENRE